MTKTRRRELELMLLGLGVEKERNVGEISDVERQLRKAPSEATGQESEKPVRRRRKSRLSSEGRKAISDAMTRRWRKFRQGKGPKPGSRKK